MQYIHDPAFENNPYLTDYSLMSGPGGGGGNNDCSACYDPNPPGWCNNPNHSCYNCCNVPIDLGFTGFVISMLFGVILMKWKV